MRTRTAVAMAATTVLGAGTAALAAGRYGSRFALRPSLRGPVPEGDVTLHSVTADQVVLTRTLSSARPGVWGLTGDDLHAAVGDVLDLTPYSVTRRLLSVQHGALTPGARVRLTPQACAGDPGSALGLDHTEVLLRGELGPLPAWFVPGARDTWVIAVHGLGATREHPLNVATALHAHGLPQLLLAYRNDPGAPASPDGIGHLGATEWRDLDTAMRYAVEYGAQRLVLFGWSTGATMALHALAGSPVRDRVSGLVLDSPVLDWEATVRAAAESNGVPDALMPLAVRAAEGRTGLLPEPVAAAADPARLTVPTLLVHGPGDTLAPWAASRELAALRADLVTLHTVPDAPHAAMWNVNPADYEETLRRFLTPLM
ncbi:prolyl oligopeptidase family serine peptidase [Streptomyces sp. NPDC008317]|uniref:alpha/beta hydrolase n=1 Tax=Streptomyces sp. NPDC008317 TaxID=3364827 RepID=UPI0036EFC2E5